ncbi:MAG: AsmA family protein [Oleiphilaceae bacterium]|nr:AsmA family protein [Oleiphilaceae bacterium]
MKVVRYALYALLGLIILLAAAVVVAVVVIDPNDYKSHIEEAVAENTNLELELAGELSWSLFPLGIEVNTVRTRLEGEHLASVEQLLARVDLFSLIRLSPSVHTFVLDGLDAHLVMDEEGQGNWERIMPETAGEEPATEEAATEPEPVQVGDADSSPLTFNISEVRIGDARVRFQDLKSGQDVTLEDFTLTASDIALGQDFPLALTFAVALKDPAFDLAGDIAMSINASQDLQQFTISDLESRYEMSGEPFGDKTVIAGLNGGLSANLADETASIRDLEATLENLRVTTSLEVQGFSNSPDLNGRFDLHEFSLRELLSRLGMPEIESEDMDTLKAISVGSDIRSDQGTVRLSDLKLRLDDTRFNGQFGYGLENGAIDLDLQGDTLNLDRYLPPTPEEGEEVATSEESPGEPTEGAGGDAELLPLETLRTLIFNARLGLDSLLASNLSISNIEVKANGRDGQLALEHARGELYEGRFNVGATLDARSDNPRWNIKQELKGVQTLPLLSDLAEIELLSGNVNMNADVSTRGNTMNRLIGESSGKANFDIQEGAFEGFNMTQMACRGIAMAHGESLASNDWPKRTPFNDMSGRILIDKGVLNNESLTAELAGLRLEGDGTVNAATLDLAYRLGLRVVGEVHRDNACRVNERIQQVVIPVRCDGNLKDDPAGLCRFDSSRFTDVLKQMGKAEIDRKRQELKQKSQEKLDAEKEKLDQERKKREEEARKKLEKEGSRLLDRFRD